MAREIGIGIVGGGYMGKAHAVAMSAVGAIFNTGLRPRLEMVAASTPESGERYRAAFGFARGTGDWRDLIHDSAVEAIVIASPQSTHRAIAEAAFAAGKPVMCEKPLGASIEDGRAMVAAAEASGLPNMIGFNYSRTPATQYARQLIAEGAIGRITWVKAEHTEDFHANESDSSWRTEGEANGTIGDLAPHLINMVLALVGPIHEVMAEHETVYAGRGNDDHVSMMVRFKDGPMGHLYSSRVAHGRKMGYAYEVVGTTGALRFDQEDQNALWLYQAQGPEAQRGFVKILTGPAHPDYLPFCQGPGHGTGYQDQIIIEARDFLQAIEMGQPVWPTFRDGLAVSEVLDAARRSHASRSWTQV